MLTRVVHILFSRLGSVFLDYLLNHALQDMAPSSALLWRALCNHLFKLQLCNLVRGVARWGGLSAVVF